MVLCLFFIALKRDTPAMKFCGNQFSYVEVITIQNKYNLQNESNYVDMLSNVIDSCPLRNKNILDMNKEFYYIIF